MHLFTLPYVFLAVALIGALFTLNACRPLARRRVGALASFFAGWVVSELPLHHIIIQVLLTAVFVGMGALDGWVGWVALAVNIIAWIGLISLFTGAGRCRDCSERALCAGLGKDYRSRTRVTWRDDPHLT